jgi:hypothetical protein
MEINGIKELDRLQEVDLREIWKHEQHGFSEWLSQEKNIELLNDEVGLTLTEIKKRFLLVHIDVIWWLLMKLLVL